MNLTRFAFSLFAAMALAPQASAVSFVVADNNADEIVLLDSVANNLARLSSFPSEGGSPNGIATDGQLIYVGDFGLGQVIAFDFSGVEQFRWNSSFSLGRLQGMTLVNGELAISNIAGPDGIQFLDPMTGALIRSIPGSGSDTEGLAFDGVSLWEITDDDLVARDPFNGVVQATIPNPASGETFGGSAITAFDSDRLLVGGTSGNWWEVASADGSVLNSGTANASFWGVTAAVPEPAALTLAVVALGMLPNRRRKAGRA